MNRKFLYAVPITVLLIILIVVSSIINQYKNADKSIPNIPSHTTYNEAIKEKLPTLITEEAYNNNCSGYIIPLQNIEKSAPNGLLEDINLAISNYPEWTLLVTSEEKKDMMSRWESTIETWGPMLSGREIEEYLETQSAVARKTNYSIEVEYSEVHYSEVATRRILVRVNDELRHTRLFEVSVSYTDRATISEWNNEITQKKERINNLKNRAEANRITIFSTAAAVGIYYLILLLITLKNKIISNKIRKSFLQQIDKREDLVNEGHYRTVLELADNYLHYFPNDTEIMAFRDRLLIFTGGDPKKAEEAYLEALKVKSYLENEQTDNFIKVQPDELERSADLIPYNPHLKDVHNKLEKIEQNRIKKEEDEIRNNIEFVYSLIRDCNIAKAREILEEIKEKDSNNPNIIQLEKMLTRRDGNFSLISSNQSVYLVEKNTVIFGREDEEDSPDIPFETSRVSREHLKLYHLGNRLEVEDLNSANGTFVNGRKLEGKKVLQNGDTLNLAKVIDLYVSVGEEENRDYYILQSNRMAVCIYSNTASLTIANTIYKVFYIDGVTLIQNEDIQVIMPNVTIILRGETYQVEEL